jgi:hypothetical protein
VPRPGLLFDCSRVCGCLAGSALRRLSRLADGWLAHDTGLADSNGGVGVASSPDQELCDRSRRHCSWSGGSQTSLVTVAFNPPGVQGRSPWQCRAPEGASDSEDPAARPHHQGGKPRSPQGARSRSGTRQMGTPVAPFGASRLHNRRSPPAEWQARPGCLEAPPRRSSQKFVRGRMPMRAYAGDARGWRVISVSSNAFYVRQDASGHGLGWYRRGLGALIRATWRRGGDSNPRYQF